MRTVVFVQEGASVTVLRGCQFLGRVSMSPSFGSPSHRSCDIPLPPLPSALIGHLVPRSIIGKTVPPFRLSGRPGAVQRNPLPAHSSYETTGNGCHKWKPLLQITDFMSTALRVLGVLGALAPLMNRVLSSTMINFVLTSFFFLSASYASPSRLRCWHPIQRKVYRSTQTKPPH